MFFYEPKLTDKTKENQCKLKKLALEALNVEYIDCDCTINEDTKTEDYKKFYEIAINDISKKVKEGN